MGLFVLEFKKRTLIYYLKDNIKIKIIKQFELKIMQMFKNDKLKINEYFICLIKLKRISETKLGQGLHICLVFNFI